MSRYVLISLVIVTMFGCASGPTCRSDHNVNADFSRYQTDGRVEELATEKERRLVREEIAEGRLTEKAMKNPREKISRVVAGMFDNFPNSPKSADANSAGRVLLASSLSAQSGLDYS